METLIKMPETTREELNQAFNAYYKDNNVLNNIVNELILKVDKSIKENVAKGKSEFGISYYYTNCKDMTHDERYDYIKYYIEKYIESLGMEISNYHLSHETFKFNIVTKFKIRSEEEIKKVVKEDKTIEIKEENKDQKLYPNCYQIEPGPNGTNVFFLIGIVALIVAAIYFFKN